MEPDEHPTVIYRKYSTNLLVRYNEMALSKTRIE